jgi:energy-coupling factor transport system substrate-specific component
VINKQLAGTILSGAIYAISSLIGLIAFFYPFWLPSIAPAGMAAHAADAPLVLTALVGLCFVALLLEAQQGAANAKMIALLGVLVAMNALLRFAEVALPGPGGFSPIFFLIILAGYVFGARFGFLMGALTLLVSALITGGVGPWLPYQMFTAGWLGLSAPLCRPLIRLMGGYNRRREIAVLMIFGGLWGLIYGAIMNIWFWPFASGPIEQYWQPGIGPAETLQRYLAFYVLTSLAWDVMGSIGTMALMAVFGSASLRALRRFQSRFSFDYRAIPATPRHSGEIDAAGQRHAIPGYGETEVLH